MTKYLTSKGVATEISSPMCMIYLRHCVIGICVLFFRGTVIVDIKLDELDINQCPQPFYVPNAFKDTARCHYESTFVSMGLCVFVLI